MEHLSLEHIAICSVLEQSGSSLGQEREDSSLSAAGPGSAFTYDLQIKLYPSHREVPEVMAEVQFSSVAQSCPTLCDCMNRSTPGLPVHHQLPDHRKSLNLGPTIRTCELLI